MGCTVSPFQGTRVGFCPIFQLPPYTVPHHHEIPLISTCPVSFPLQGMPHTVLRSSTRSVQTLPWVSISDLGQLGGGKKCCLFHAQATELKVELVWTMSVLLPMSASASKCQGLHLRRSLWQINKSLLGEPSSSFSFRWLVL